MTVLFILKFEIFYIDRLHIHLDLHKCKEQIRFILKFGEINMWRIIDGCGWDFPDQETLSKMNKNIEDALNKIALHYDVETSIDIYPEGVIAKPSFG